MRVSFVYILFFNCQMEQPHNHFRLIWTYSHGYFIHWLLKQINHLKELMPYFSESHPFGIAPGGNSDLCTKAVSVYLSRLPELPGKVNNEDYWQDNIFFLLHNNKVYPDFVLISAGKTDSWEEGNVLRSKEDLTPGADGESTFARWSL